MSEKLKLIYDSEKNFIEVDTDVIEISGFIKGMLSDYSSNIEDSGGLLLQKKVSGKILEKVVLFCKHYKNNPMGEIPMPLESNDLSGIVSTWYLEFLDIGIKELTDLYNAADYLNIQPLI